MKLLIALTLAMLASLAVLGALASADMEACESHHSRDTCANALWR